MSSNRAFVSHSGRNPILFAFKQPQQSHSTVYTSVYIYTYIIFISISHSISIYSSTKHRNDNGRRSRIREPLHQHHPHGAGIPERFQAAEPRAIPIHHVPASRTYIPQPISSLFLTSIDSLTTHCSNPVGSPAATSTRGTRKGPKTTSTCRSWRKRRRTRVILRTRSILR